jgi:transcriptional regulator with XRE-family HTH domain
MPLQRKRKSPPRLYIGQWIAAVDRTQAEIAKAADITESYLSEIVSGKKYPSAAVIAAIADAIGVGWDALRREPPPRVMLSTAQRLAPKHFEALAELLEGMKKPRS